MNADNVVQDLPGAAAGFIQGALQSRSGRGRADQLR
jgi:hypothetical protein